jgi:hypothetical protein
MSDHGKIETNDAEEAREQGLENVENLHTGGEPDQDTGPEVDEAGSDPESNVTGRSKPSSDGVAQHDSDEQASNH